MPIENLRQRISPKVLLRRLFKSLAREPRSGASQDSFSVAHTPNTPKPAAPTQSALAKPAPQSAPKPLPSKPPGMLDEASALARSHDPNVQMANWQKIYGGDESRAQYAKAYWTAVLSAAQKVGSEGGLSSQQLIRYLGTRRQNIAEALEHVEAHKFGKDVLELSNPGEVMTPVMPRYGEFPHVKAFLQKLRNQGDAPFGDALRSAPFHPGTRWTIYAKDAEGQPIRLSSTIDMSPEQVLWLQALPSSQLNQQIEFLYQEALRPVQGTPQERMQALCISVGRLHWWMARHCPFERGSAAVFDMVSSTLLRHHGFNHAGWRPQVSADVVALCTPDPEVFAQGYRGLMRQDPVAIA